MEIKGLIKKLKDTIMPYAVAGAIAFGSANFTGCASGNQSAGQNYPSYKKAMKVLGAKDFSELEYMRTGGYITSRQLDVSLRAIAGVYAGTISVNRNEETSYDGKGKKTTVIKTKAEGSYSEALYPEAMKRVLREADTNRDKIITEKETMDLQSQVFEKYAK